jgi:lipoate-protein ligase A
MLLIRNLSQDPYYNQALEEYLLEHYRERKIFMLWRSRPAVVCGCYQNIFAEVDVARAQEMGVAVVRRITGGGTVYHDLGNWNYTLIADAPAGDLGYEKYLEPVVRALRRVGVPASINRESDIAIDGRKVSGSAQKIVKGRILHHGTLLYQCDLKALAFLANGQREYFESKAVKSVPWPVTNMIDSMAGQKLSPEKFGENFLKAISQEETLEPMELSAKEQEEVKRLAAEKYCTWEWNYGKSPAFVYHRTFPFQGKTIAIEYQAKKGMITKFTVTPEVPVLSETLQGVRLLLEEIKQALELLPEWRRLEEYIL